MKKIIITFLFALLFIAPPTLTLAEEETPKFTPQVNIGESFQTEDPVEIGNKYESSTGDMYFRASLLPKYIQAIYQYGQGVVGILAVIILMIGGVIWITSAGDSGKIGQAKKMILGSITGIIILFTSWIILNTINPDLTNLQALDIKMIEREARVCCESSGGTATMTSLKECENYVGTTPYESTDEIKYEVENGHCQEIKMQCNVLYDCDGNVVWCLDSENGQQMELKENCGSLFSEDIKNLYLLRDSSCSSLSECGNKKISCEGIDNAEKCPKNGDGDKINDAYCYNDVCYIGKGSEFEPCGTKPNAYCSAKTCSELGDANSKYYRDNSNDGRSCGTLYCCYKN